MTLAEVALAAILSLAGPRSAPPERLALLAEDVALAASLTGGAPFEGPASREAAALALVAIAAGETGFRARWMDCIEAGDEGRSVSAFQLMAGLAWYGARRGELCPSSPLAAWNALRVLRHHEAFCTRSAPGGWFAGYASGSCARTSSVARAHCARWERLSVAAGLEGASCARRGLVGYARRHEPPPDLGAPLPRRPCGAPPLP